MHVRLEQHLTETLCCPSILEQEVEVVFLLLRYHTSQLFYEHLIWDFSKDAPTN